jgi:hypothetical protein
VDAALTEVAAMSPRLALFVLVLAATPGCAVRTWQTDSRPIPRALAEGSGQKVRLELRDGSLMTLTWPFLDGDTVTGLRSARSAARVRLPLADVRSVARLRTNWPLSIVASAAGTAGAMVGLAAIFCSATKCVDFGGIHILPPGSM